MRNAATIICFFLFCRDVVFANEPMHLCQQACVSISWNSCIRDTLFRKDIQRLKSGSAFLMCDSIIGGDWNVYLVTNRHMLPDTTACDGFLHIRFRTDTSTELIEAKIVDSLKHYKSSVRLHPTADVAAVKITSELSQRHLALQKWLRTELLATDSLMYNNDVAAGDEVLIFGFPISLYDQRNAFPLVMTGTISSDPFEEFVFNYQIRSTTKDIPESINGFIINANLYSGASGSLVMLKPAWNFFHKSNPIRTMMIMGIYSSALASAGEGHGPILRSGIGMVYSAAAIQETLNLFKSSFK